jgi:predicted nucleic acid-binding Zn ribbon protein
MNALFGSLAGLLKEFGDNPDVREAVIFAAWKKIAGEALSEQAIPVDLNGERLAVAVENKMWKRHLEDLSGQMLFKINSALGAPMVTFIEFRVDTKFFRTRDKQRRKTEIEAKESAETARGEITEKLRASADAIRDEDLRERFLLAAGRCLARKKTLAARD